MHNLIVFVGIWVRLVLVFLTGAMVYVATRPRVSNESPGAGNYVLGHTSRPEGLVPEGQYREEAV